MVVALILKAQLSGWVFWWLFRQAWGQCAVSTYLSTARVLGLWPLCFALWASLGLLQLLSNFFWWLYSLLRPKSMVSMEWWQSLADITKELRIYITLWTWSLLEEQWVSNTISDVKKGHTVHLTKLSALCPRSKIPLNCDESLTLNLYKGLNCRTCDEHLAISKSCAAYI